MTAPARHRPQVRTRHPESPRSGGPARRAARRPPNRREELRGSVKTPGLERAEDVKIVLAAVGTRMPGWVDTAFEGYAKRLPPACRLTLHEVPAAYRGGSRKGAAAAASVRREGEGLLRAVPHGARIVALDERGAGWSTAELAERLAAWLAGGRDIALLAGGPDGLSPECRERAELTWSLSRLTFPHALVRVIVAEQLWRAWSLLNRHPYHRA